MAIRSEQRNFGSTMSQSQVDEGLRKYMLRVYNYMGSGLALTGIVAYVVAHTGLYQALYGSGIGFIIMFAPLGIVFFMGAKINSMKPTTAQTLFWVFATLMGMSLSSSDHLANVMSKMKDDVQIMLSQLETNQFGLCCMYDYN